MPFRIQTEPRQAVERAVSRGRVDGEGTIEGGRGFVRDDGHRMSSARDGSFDTLKRQLHVGWMSHHDLVNGLAEAERSALRSRAVGLEQDLVGDGQ